jgi:hypothetical protein
MKGRSRGTHFSCYTVADNVSGHDDDLRHDLEDGTVHFIDNHIFLLEEKIAFADDGAQLMNENVLTRRKKAYPS